MKIRTGFVSNSSTTSFTIYGISLSEKSEVKDAWNKLFPDKPFDDEEFCDMCEDIAKKLELTMHYGEEGYTMYIGKDWEDIPDDVTPRQFKKEIEDKLKEAFGESTKYGLHSEAYRDG